LRELDRPTEQLERRVAELEARLAAHEAEYAQLAERLAAEKLRYQDLVEQIPAVVYRYELADRDGTLYLSPYLTKLLGYTPGDWRELALTWDMVAHPDDVPQVRGQFAAAWSAGRSAVCEYRMRHRDGQYIWVKNEAMLLPDAEGRPAICQGFILNIDKRRRAEVALHELNASLELRVQERTRELEQTNLALLRSSALLNTIINSLDTGLALLSGDGRVLLANQALAELYQRDLGQITGGPWAEICAVTTPYILDAARTGVALSGREQLVRPDQTRAIVDLRAFPLQTAGEPVEQVVLHLVNVTERLQLQELMLQNERLAARGRLAAIVAHEVNSPLQAIQNLLYLAANDNATERDSYLGMITNEIDRISGLIRRLLDIHKPGDAERRQVDVNDVVEKVLALIRSISARHNIRVTTDLNAAVPRVLGRGDQLTQVLLNLIMNAIEAMPGGGELRIRSGARAARSADGLRMLDAGRVVEIEVADTGSGLASDTLARVFEPFFTTKQQGSGLGLAISAQIVEQYGGRLLARNDAVGAVFTVLIPVAALEKQTAA
jgi:PAS domain S-box-containing protein